MSSCLLCKSEEAELRRAQRRHSRAIDEELRRERAEYRSTYRLLLQGPSGSGKSTIMKQLRILCGNVFNEKEEQMIISEIKSDIREIITAVIKAMPTIHPPIALELPENEAHVKYILEVATKPDYDFPKEFYEVCMKLWEDKGVMECYGRSNEYQLLDCTPYFMNAEKLQAVASPYFRPNNDDILHCRVKTEGIAEQKYVIDKVKFHIIDVSGLQCHRRIWMHRILDDLMAILFIVSCSSYNLSLKEDPSMNQLEEDLQLFKGLWNNIKRWPIKVSVIMFLNKQDLLKVKVLEGCFKIETYFPEYSSYQIANDDAHDDPEENAEVRRAKEFIKDLFVKVTEASPDDRYSFYTHFTSAIDTENVCKVFNDCRDNIQRIHLRQYDLL